VTETKDMNRFFRLCASLTALALLPPTSEAVAQDYPTRPVRVIATSSAGGTSDIFMRALADELHKSLGQPFIVENRPGGAFNIGARACAEAPPDGYTLCIIPGEPLVFNQRVLGSGPSAPAKKAARHRGFLRGHRRAVIGVGSCARPMPARSPPMRPASPAAMGIAPRP
jgi:hypothetical protein